MPVKRTFFDPRSWRFHNRFRAGNLPGDGLFRHSGRMRVHNFTHRCGQNAKASQKFIERLTRRARIRYTAESVFIRRFRPRPTLRPEHFSP